VALNREAVGGQGRRPAPRYGDGPLIADTDADRRKPGLSSVPQPI
jgi:hypothetical protein